VKDKKQLKERLVERDGLRCSVSGEEVDSIDELELTHILPLVEGGGSGIENLKLVKSQYHRLLDNEHNRSKQLFDGLSNKQRELDDREKASFEREQTYRSEIDRQKNELEGLSQMLIQRKRLADQEASIQEMLQKSEMDLAARTKKLEEQSHLVQTTFLEREKQLNYASEELEKEKEKYKLETRKEIERRSHSYVSESLASLGESAVKYHKISRNWSALGAVSLVLGVLTGIYFGMKGLTPVEGQKEIGWSQVTFFAFKGVIVIGLFVALAKYCFTYSQSFMHESIKNGERKHAINFGKFYLETYGADAEWAQIKEAFEHWNINSSSAFSGNDADKFDPRIVEKTIQLAESFQKLSKGLKDEGGKEKKEAS
jgi:hypothetical protein